MRKEKDDFDDIYISRLKRLLDTSGDEEDEEIMATIAYGAVVANRPIKDAIHVENPKTKGPKKTCGRQGTVLGTGMKTVSKRVCPSKEGYF